MIREVAPAKINLALHVRRRRADGYHELETLFAFATDGDVVTVEQADRDTLHVEGPFAAALGGSTTDADNLVARARDALRGLHHVPPVAITLTKNLPVASGIGGGSADAAATLRALARWIRIDPATLHDVAAGLGADVPACLRSRTTLGTGRGDALADVSGLEGTPLLLVNPGVGVSTAAVFAAWDGVDRGPLMDGGLLGRAFAGRNDLEPPAIAIAPVIAQVRSVLDAAPGAILSRMSGSGATCFALFDSVGDRNAAAAATRARGWWTMETSVA